VIEAFTDLHRFIEEQNKNGLGEWYSRLAKFGEYSAEKMKDYLETLADLNYEIQEASKTAIEEAVETVRMALKGAQRTAKVAADVASEVASKTTARAIMKGVTKEAAKGIAEAAGKTAAESVLKAISKGTTEVGEAFLKSVASKAAGIASDAAITAAARIAGKGAAEAGGKSAVKLIGRVGRLLPFLNIAVLLVDGVDIYHAGQEINVGSKTEHQLRGKAESLKQEVREKAIPIYNCYAKRLNWPRLDTSRF
jgi:hypothetical protein